MIKKDHFKKNCDHFRFRYFLKSSVPDETVREQAGNANLNLQTVVDFLHCDHDSYFFLLFKIIYRTGLRCRKTIKKTKS